MTSPTRFLDGPGVIPSHSSEAYRRLLERLLMLSRTGTKLGLHRVQEVLEQLEHPERAVPMVHVAGSNGKGSTSAFLANILARSGRRVGLFTSPHLISLNERIQVVSSRSECISEEDLIRAVATLEEVAPGFGELTFFEAITLVGLIAFRQAAVDIAVIEAGLGARLDSTRLVEAQLTILTDLSLEHTDILGDSIEEIAQEEGAVVRPEVPLVMADGPRSAMTVVDNLAAEAEAPVYRLGRDFDFTASLDGSFDFHLPHQTISKVYPSLIGQHQGRNAALAAYSAKLIDPSLMEETIREGLQQTLWPGRMEWFVKSDQPRILLDGAHNPHASKAFARALAGVPYAGPRHFVFGVLQDKNTPEMLEALAPRAASFVLTRPGSVRARDPADVLRVLDEVIGFEGRVEIEDSPSLALKHALELAQNDGGWVVVCGSLYLVGDVRAEILRDWGLKS